MLHVAGLEFDPTQKSNDLPLTDWILRQRQIVIRDALVTWNDDARNAPQLVLDRVQFRLENRFGRHRFGIAGTPPADVSAPIDIRGDIQGGSFKEWQKARGEIYVRLDYADVEAWREWLPLPVEIAAGKGALRVWFDFASGDVREIVADLELADVKAAAAARACRSSSSRTCRDASAGGARRRKRELFARDLAFVTAARARLEPTNFTVSMRAAAGGGAPGGELEFDRLQLQPLRELGGIPAVACALARRSRPFCASRDAHARPCALGRTDGRAHRLRRGRGVRESRHRSPGCDSRRGGTRPAASMPTEKGGEIKLATRGAIARAAARVRRPDPVRFVAGRTAVGPHGWAHTRRHPAPGVHQCADGRPCQRHLSHGGPGAR